MIKKLKINRPNNSHNFIEEIFEKLSISITKFTGNTSALIIAFSLIIIWSVSGPFFNFSETWQMIINTLTTIITFLMVFLIQRTQNKDSLAIQLKLNEIIAAIPGASNRLVDAEDVSERELKTLKSQYKKLSILIEKDTDLRKSHSIDEA